MNKIYRVVSVFLTLAVVGILSTSCDKYFEDYIVTPNDPAEVTPGLLLTSVQISTFATFGGQMARQSGVMIQHMAGTSTGSQSLEIANYNITEQTNVNEWNGIYSGAIMNANIIIREYGSKNPWYAGISKVLLAMNVGLATDLWGDVPLSEASLGQSGNLAPKYDSQEDVIAGIQDLLDQAIVDLGKDATANSLFPGTDDLIYGGDVTSWLKTAYALKARYANRLSQRDPSGSATAALSALANSYSSSAEDCNQIYGSGTSQNQWFAYGNERAGYMQVSETFVDSLTNSADPRLPVFVGLDDNGGYSGTPFDDVDVTGTSYVGAYYASANSSIPLVSYVELKFIEAEAKLRNGDAGGAATAHNDAVKASIMQVTGAADATYEGTYASETAASITLEKIMYQKWVALFIQCEAYADWRRTGFPTLTPNPNAVYSPASIPLRLPTIQDERLYNPNATVVGDITMPVWWDN